MSREMLAAIELRASSRLVHDAGSTVLTDIDVPANPPAADRLIGGNVRHPAEAYAGTRPFGESAALWAAVGLPSEKLSGQAGTEKSCKGSH